MNRELNVVFLGEVGFPRGFASMQRLILMAKGLVYENVKATVVSRKGVWEKGDNVQFEKKGTFEGVDYIYTSKDLYRREAFLNRNYNKLAGIYGEYKFLKKLKSHNPDLVAIVYNKKIVHVLRYLIICKSLGVKTLYNLVEKASAMQSDKGFVRKLNNTILDKYLIKYFNGALPISNKLVDFYSSVAPNKPCLKVPVVCDFQKFDIAKKEVTPYFLYCGGINYKEVIEFIVRSFEKLPSDNDFKLFMIVSGDNREKIKKLENKIKDTLGTDRFKLYSNVSYEKLIDLYVNAKALLIPLRNTEQDSSRFPHKLGEYLASGNPVITNNVGEINLYFKDGVNALIANAYEEGSFAEKMNFIIEESKKSKQIGLAGHAMGLNEFDYRSHGKRIREFIELHY